MDFCNNRDKFVTDSSQFVLVLFDTLELSILTDGIMPSATLESQSRKLPLWQLATSKVVFVDMCKFCTLLRGTFTIFRSDLVGCGSTYRKVISCRVSPCGTQ